MLVSECLALVAKADHVGGNVKAMQAQEKCVNNQVDSTWNIGYIINTS